MSDYYSPSAETLAPYGPDELPEREIEVTVSVTLRKTVKVKVNDYEVDEYGDEDGRHPLYDYSGCDLHKAVENQIILPQNHAEFKDWYVYDMEVVKE